MAARAWSGPAQPVIHPHATQTARKRLEICVTWPARSAIHPEEKNRQSIHSCARAQIDAGAPRSPAIEPFHTQDAQGWLSELAAAV